MSDLFTCDTEINKTNLCIKASELIHWAPQDYEPFKKIHKHTLCISSIEKFLHITILYLAEN